MSPPDTNIKTEEKRHKPSLIGMAAVVIFAILLLGLLTIYVANRGGDPTGSDTEVDGRTGEVESQTTGSE